MKRAPQGIVSLPCVNYFASSRPSSWCEMITWISIVNFRKTCRWATINEEAQALPRCQHLGGRLVTRNCSSRAPAVHLWRRSSDLRLSFFISSNLPTFIMFQRVFFQAFSLDLFRCGDPRLCDQVNSCFSLRDVSAVRYLGWLNLPEEKNLVVLCHAFWMLDWQKKLYASWHC
jgi:hypothetical protein